MIKRTINTNKNRYLKYTQFRKEIFSNLAPGDSQIILQLLPWLLSVNHPKCPGYLPELTRPFKVFNIDNDKEIRKLEPLFKRRFGVSGHGSLLSPTTSSCLIQGIYTIGSIGTIAQTASSDCDMWVCCNKGELGGGLWHRLGQKLNLIKDWMDTSVKMPVFFFLSDVADIRAGNFGGVDEESCGSSQSNVLKEEFYRTCIVISGKIPLWWVAHDKGDGIEYGKALAEVESGRYGDYDLIDLGDIEKIGIQEYFGAALWQLNKSLTRPMKSMIKMVLLEMMINGRDKRLMSHSSGRRSSILRPPPPASTPWSSPCGRSSSTSTTIPTSERSSSSRSAST
jgi:adenylate cyclase class 1